MQALLEKGGLVTRLFLGLIALVEVILLDEVAHLLHDGALADTNFRVDLDQIFLAVLRRRCVLAIRRDGAVCEPNDELVLLNPPDDVDSLFVVEALDLALVPQHRVEHQYEAVLRAHHHAHLLVLLVSEQVLVYRDRRRLRLLAERHVVVLHALRQVVADYHQALLARGLLRHHEDALVLLFGGL